MLDTHINFNQSLVDRARVKQTAMGEGDAEILLHSFLRDIELILLNRIRALDYSSTPDPNAQIYSGIPWDAIVSHTLQKIAPSTQPTQRHPRPTSCPPPADDSRSTQSPNVFFKRDEGRGEEEGGSRSLSQGSRGSGVSLQKNESQGGMVGIE